MWVIVIGQLFVDGVKRGCKIRNPPPDGGCRRPFPMRHEESLLLGNVPIIMLRIILQKIETSYYVASTTMLNCERIEGFEKEWI